MFKFNRGRFVKEIEATSAKRKKPVFWLVLNKLVRYITLGRNGLAETNTLSQGILKGEVSLFDWFGLVCFANKNINYKLSYN